MDLLQREYEHFLTLCQTENISKASEIIGIGQAGLSKSLRKLEESLGVPLFLRKGRGVEKTEFGVSLEKRLLVVKESWEEGVSKEKELMSEVAGRIKIGCHSITAKNLLTDLFPKLCGKYPMLDLELVLDKSGSVTKDVVDSKIDFGIVANPSPYPDLVIKKMRKEFVAAFVKGEKDPSLIYFNPDMIESGRLLKKFKNKKLVPISDYEVLADIATSKKSSGIYILPRPISDRIKGLTKVGGNLMNVDICLIYRADRPKTRPFLTILGHLKSLE